MKIKLTFLLLFLTFIGFSQNQENSGSVFYKINASKKKSDQGVKDSNIDFYNRTISRLDELKYHLEFNKEKSLFKIESALVNDTDKSDFFLKSAKLLGGEEIYYTNLKNQKVTIQRTMLGEIFLIEDAIRTDWKLTSETKLIANYKCLKAEMILEKNKIYVNDIKITAWFTTEIPLPFGPRGYSGLPGLILELNYGDINYYATEITFENQVQINKPTQGIKITSEEFEAYISQKIDEYGFENKSKN
ncbi:GLPGLI family protein [Gelidibacter gilvus]|uniref:GLPGLI family protein n=1 Tax=Gelidibacter gilvus TaxID=59602 RepID=A0A4Q0XKG9_9FLAO|nr:GLPGLI family protein [Gelidibacter gilvus]RXJ52749.1 GLPGLI family protein [Gelidibacter gilvus]